MVAATTGPARRTLDRMVFWLGMALGFVVVVVLMSAYARHADRVEDDSSYLNEEQLFTPYGQKYLDIMLFRGGDD